MDVYLDPIRDTIETFELDCTVENVIGTEAERDFYLQHYNECERRRYDFVYNEQMIIRLFKRYVVKHVTHTMATALHNIMCHLNNLTVWLMNTYNVAFGVYSSVDHRIDQLVDLESSSTYADVVYSEFKKWVNQTKKGPYSFQHNA
jgi:hypothetical protein